MTASSQIVFAMRATSPKYTPTMRPTFGWLLRLAIQQSHRNPRPHRPLYFLFFRRSICHPKRWANVLPHAFRPCASPLQFPPPTDTIDRLVVTSSFQMAAPKTGAPPISHFFDGRHFGAPNKGIEGSASEPSRRAPPLGARRAAAQGFGSMADVAMDRGSKAAGR